MASFTIRIVLHEANSDHYQDLHDRMQLDMGALRTIQAGSVTYDLPDGEYIMSSQSTCSDVCALALKTASKVKAKPTPSVLVTESVNRSFILRPVPGDS